MRSVNASRFSSFFVSLEAVCYLGATRCVGENDFCFVVYDLCEEEAIESFSTQSILGEEEGVFVERTKSSESVT